MIITNIKYNEKKSLFNIEINDENFLISYELYNNLQLKSDMEININIYNKIINESLYQNLKYKAENYINYKRRTIFEVKTKLYKDTKNNEVLNKIIEYYVNLNLLDDTKYAYDYIDYALNIKNYSKAYTKNKLNQKGISSNTINRILNEYDDNIEYKNAKIIFNKKYSDYDLSKQEQIQKIYRYMTYKGFSYTLIRILLEELK